MRAILAPLALLAAFGCAKPPPPAPAPKPAPPQADLALVGGRVRIDAARAPKTAIAVRAGRVVQVGSDEAIAGWIGPDTRVVDLKGRTAIPGLVDAHMHLTGLGKRRLGVNLIGTKTLAEVQAKVAAAAATAPKGQWILGRGWDQNDWSDREGFPAAADLDAVAPNHPVALTRVDGHALWVNSAAMARAKIDRRTRAGTGGRIVKSKGLPTGIFVDNAMALIRDHVPPLTPAQLKQAILLGQAECLAAGLTGVHDMGIGAEALAAMIALDEAKELKLRVYGAHDGTAPDLSPALEAGPRQVDPASERRLTVRAVKFFADGALGSRGAAMLEPYSDDPKNSGLLLVEPAVLEARIRTATDEGFQVATHAIGDRANATVLDIYARVFGKRAFVHRPRIEHVQIVAELDLERFGKEGVIASVQPTHATSDMPWAEKRVGPERIRGAYAWHTLLTKNATVAAGSDAPVEKVAPLLGLYAAFTRKDPLGFPEGGWYPEESMTRAQALNAFTRGAAWAGFSEKDLGQLDEGYLADITVLSADPLTVPEDDFLKTQVMLTIVGGEILYVSGDADAPPVTKTSTAS